MTSRHIAAVYGTSGLELTPDEAAFFRDADPLGFILFARNVDTPEQLKRLTGALRDAVGRDAPVMVDQEGGRVQRLRAPYWHEWLPPLEQVARSVAGKMERGIWLRYRVMAEELRAVGIDCDCAPTLDIASAATHPFLRNRCFGEDVATVIRAGRACAEGLLAGGVLPVMKHMPGHGRTVVDSHMELPTANASADELFDTDFAPFRALSDLPMGMTAHIVVPAYDAARPATQSPGMIHVIREVIGFCGLLFSDDLAMEALSGTIPERGRKAISAGCDVVLHCKGSVAEMAEVAEAVGQMTPSAMSRARSALSRREVSRAIDVNQLLAELEDLILPEEATAAHG